MSAKSANSVPVLIVGGGGHSLVIWDALERNGYRTIGFTDPAMPPGTTKRLGQLSRPVLGDDSILEAYVAREAGLKLFVGVGPEPPRLREALIAKVEAFGPERMLVAVHPDATIAASARIGLDTIVMAGAVINAEVEIGRHSVINTGATVDHECQIGQGVFVQPGAHLGGRVVVEDGAVVGIGASVNDGVHIGRNAYVGGGAFVRRDVPSNTIVVGVPARFLRYRSQD